MALININAPQCTSYQGPPAFSKSVQLICSYSPLVINRLKYSLYYLKFQPEKVVRHITAYHLPL